MKATLKKLFYSLFTMQLMALLILLFFVAIGTATFIENDFGTPASKALIYNAKWFEILLFLLTVNLIVNIVRYRMYRKEKWPVFLFHLSFIIIIIGAGLTRFTGEEGLLHIREGNASNKVVSDNTYFRFKVHDTRVQYAFEKKLFLNPLYNPGFSNGVDFNGTDVSVHYVDYLMNVKDTLVPDANGKNYIELVTSSGSGRETVYLEEGSVTSVGMLKIRFGDTAGAAGMKIFWRADSLFFVSPFPVQFMKMDDRSSGTLAADTVHPFEMRRLYTVQGINLVFKGFHEKVKKEMVSHPSKKSTGLDALVVEVSAGTESKKVFLKGMSGLVTPPVMFELGGLNFELSYGAKYLYLPFYILLRDFQLERYPGSMSPASYASEVTLIDEERGVEMPYRIYMNHVLDYRGYRFFQSSYDKDELGTVLSVNKDRPGTLVSYLGYLLMGLGMFITLFMKKTRFGRLSEKVSKLRKVATAMAALMLLSQVGFAQQTDSLKVIPKAHAAKFGMLQVQDRGGRIKPMNTLSSEVLRKVTRKSRFLGLNADQVLLGMVYQGEFWQKQPMIKVKHEGVAEMLGIEGDYAAFDDFFDENYNYKLQEAVNEANRKKPAMQSQLDKELIKVDERLNICYMVFTGQWFRIFPLPGDPNHTWYAPPEAPKVFKGKDSLFVVSVFPMYFAAMDHSFETGDWSKTDEILEAMSNFQKKYGEAVIIPESKLKAEIFYNKSLIFNRLFYYYFTFGLLFLIALFIQMFKGGKVLRSIIRIFSWLVIFGFAVHTGGLLLRWYISGHAPWSNAYESMIYIAWATVLSGFVFGRSSKITLATTALLASFILMVAHLNWLDPEITNLVPVLNSYWLMIHVAMITASYGFLALGALLGFLNLILFILSDKQNRKIKNTVEELTAINEMTLEIGLFMLSIGTFLGGVWANESWGRYWGWDAKETWALASMLLYAFVVHMRMVPGLKGKYAFNLASLLAFSSIIMTYFGVNYYLSGLHSYAAGDPVPIPTFVYYTIGVVGIIAMWAYYKFKKAW